MSKRYYFYLKGPSKVFKDDLNYHITNSFDIKDSKDGSQSIVLYAWTKNEKIAELFKMTRNMDNYKVVESDEKLNRDIQKAEDRIDNLKLSLYQLVGENEEVKSIVCTKNEYDTVHDMDVASIREALFDSNIVLEKVPPNIFKEEIRLALDVFGYTDLYMLVHGFYPNGIDVLTDNELDDLEDLMSYNDSFEVTTSGHQTFKVKINEVGLLCMIFKYPIFGEI